MLHKTVIPILEILLAKQDSLFNYAGNVRENLEAANPALTLRSAPVQAGVPCSPGSRTPFRAAVQGRKQKLLGQGSLEALNLGSGEGQTCKEASSKQKAQALPFPDSDVLHADSTDPAQRLNKGEESTCSSDSEFLPLHQRLQMRQAATHFGPQPELESPEVQHLHASDHFSRVHFL